MKNIDNTLELFEKAREQRQVVSSEYIAIQLSEKGKLYAPSTFHIKNFTVAEVLDLALSEVEELPNKVLTFLSSKVLEEDVDIGKFSKEEYIETVFNIFKIFYTSTIKQHDYTLQESDYTYLQNMNGGPNSPEYLKLVSDLETGVWKPKFNLDLSNVTTFELPENFIKKVTVGNSEKGFSYAYGLPTYRDIRDVEDFIHIIFNKESTKLASVEKLVNLRNDMLKRRLKGENISKDSIPPIPRQLETEYNDFIYRRQLIYTKAMRAAYLREYNGEDVSDLSIEEKMKLVADPRLDLKTYTNFLNKINGQKIGINKDVKILSPITNAPTTYYYPLDALVALRPFEVNNLLELVVSLSKNTSNSYNDIMRMQMDQALALHNTLANLAEKEREESEKQKEEQMGSANSMLRNPGFNMNGMQSQMNKMAGSIKAPSMSSMPNIGSFKF